MRYRITTVANLVDWANEVLDVTSEEAKLVAQAVWNREDFPSHVHNTDLTDYLESIPDEWLYAVAAGETPKQWTPDD